jgi:hypothetical protein
MTQPNDPHRTRPWITFLACAFALAFTVVTGCGDDSAASSPSAPSSGEPSSGEPSSGEPSSGESAPSEPSSGEPSPSATELSDEARGHVRTALGSYENIRASLVADDGEIATEAERLATAADAAKAGAPAAHAADLDAIATESRRLAELPSEDLDGARETFGEVSRHVVALLRREQSLAADLHVFVCPMASGFQKWVQPTDELSNPYMGSSMPQCGSPSTLE